MSCILSAYTSLCGFGSWALSRSFCESSVFPKNPKSLVLKCGLFTFSGTQEILVLEVFHRSKILHWLGKCLFRFFFLCDCKGRDGGNGTKHGYLWAPFLRKLSLRDFTWKLMVYKFTILSLACLHSALIVFRCLEAYVYPHINTTHS